MEYYFYLFLILQIFPNFNDSINLRRDYDTHSENYILVPYYLKIKGLKIFPQKFIWYSLKLIQQGHISSGKEISREISINPQVRVHLGTYKFGGKQLKSLISDMGLSLGASTSFCKFTCFFFVYFHFRSFFLILKNHIFIQQNKINILIYI